MFNIQSDKFKILCITTADIVKIVNKKPINDFIIILNKVRL